MKNVLDVGVLMIQSKNNKNVWYIFPGALIEKKTFEGGWYFTDETENFGGGPYASEQEAIDELNKYVEWLYKGISNVTV